ncbi:MAG: hypothetical protein WD489_03740 [Rhodovibrionaceae bacterium]
MSKTILLQRTSHSLLRARHHFPFHFPAAHASLGRRGRTKKAVQRNHLTKIGEDSPLGIAGFIYSAIFTTSAICLQSVKIYR